MLARLRERGWRVLGTEYGERPPVTTPGIDIRYAPLEECGLPPESFDVITMWHVLEHLPDPQATLAEAHRLLRPGGVLLIAVPNFGSLQARLTGPYWFHLDVPRHLFQFRSRDLVTLLERVGLSVGRTRRFSFEYDTFGFVQSMLNRALPRPNLLFDFLAHGGSRTPSAPAGTAVSLAMAPFLMVAACVFCPLESALGFGGTVEVVARKGAPA
jgi:SAM-dependent methyltransferase